MSHRLAMTAQIALLQLLNSSASGAGWDYSFNKTGGNASCVIDVTTGNVSGATFYLSGNGDEKSFELVVQVQSDPHEFEKNLPSHVEIAGHVRDLQSAEAIYLDGQSSSTIKLTEQQWLSFKDDISFKPEARSARFVVGSRSLEVPLRGLKEAITAAAKDCGN